MIDIGHRLWAIAEGYIPETSTGPAPEMTSPAQPRCTAIPGSISTTSFSNGLATFPHGGLKTGAGPST